jgi:hypothetical protein
MTTECNLKSYQFQPLKRREVISAFDGGAITSDGGGLLLREVEARCSIIGQFSECFADYRDPDLIEHTVEELLGQRVYGIALGYEDLNDHDDLRFDPLLATLVGKSDPSGSDRVRERDKGKPLAGKSTLNRLELTTPEADSSSRYKKIYLDPDKVDHSMVEIFIQSYREAPQSIIIDLDATDDPLHGNQEGRFFHGYYKSYCYLPLYIFCADHLLCARLRPSNIDASEGSVDELDRIVKQIRAAWPEVRIAIRGDSGFCREDIMNWCEANDVHYILGLAKNSRLKKAIEDELALAKKEYGETGKAARVFKDFTYQTLKSWGRSRRVVGKAEHLAKGANPRFVVTSFTGDDYDGRELYEEIYCARGEMENRIKEQQLYLFADRTSCSKMQANQVRLYMSSIAYILVSAFRRLGLHETEMARAQCHTIRLKLFKIGVLIRVTVRRVMASMAGGYPYENIFAQAYENLARAGPTYS